MREISPRRQTEPVPGYYLLRLCPGGWQVPCIVFEHRGCYSCEVDGKLIPGSWTADELENFWPPINSAEDNQVLRISLYGEKCQDASQYEWRHAMKAWARRNSPHHPSLHPDKPIEIRLLPAEEF